MKKGIILINAYATSESELYGARRLKEELERCGVTAEIRRNVLITELQADFCVYLDKDKYAGELLEQSGLRLFNRLESIAVCDDKMQTHIALSGLPMPDTLAGPLCYMPDAAVSRELLEGVAGRFGFPLVVKECYGSLGKGVYKADDMTQLSEIAERVKCKPHLFQKFIAGSAGRDVRVIVIGGKVFSAMLRTSQNDFRSNVELGGKGEKFALDSEGVKLCETVAKRLNLDYCGIDLLFGEKGYLVCEVNSNAFFGGMERVTGLNVARAYAEHILREI